MNPKENEEQYRRYVENAPIGIFICDQNGRYTQVNPATEKITGYSKEELLKMSIPDLLPPESYELAGKLFQNVLETGETSGDEFNFRRKNGQIGTWLLDSVRITPTEFMGLVTDITERKKNERELRESEKKFRALVENIDDVIFTLDPNGRFTFISQTVEPNFGYSPTEVEGLPFSKFVFQDDLVALNESFQRTFSGSKEVYEFRIRNKNGEIRWVSTRSSLVTENSHYAMVTGIMTDVTERRLNDEKIRRLSIEDTLTGLYNRGFFEAELKRLDVERQLPLSVLMMDVDGLKLTNDTFGHMEGDKLLTGTAEILKKLLRKEEIVARWGGDEFVVLLPKTSSETSEEIVHRIINMCGRTKQKIPLHLSIGFATKTEQHQPIKDIIKEAEEYMYRRKLLQKESISSAIITALEQTLSEKSHETKEHTDRIKDLSLKLGKKIGLTSNQLDALSLLATLHDIGKVTVGEDILMKKGSLTDDEWKIMKNHTTKGYNIALSTSQIRHIANEILSCHERWDGLGYPRGLKGDEIPLLSRIVFIVDAFDTMTSKRYYKEAVTKNEAIEELKLCSGKQFDPELVENFIWIIKD